MEGSMNLKDLFNADAIDKTFREVANQLGKSLALKGMLENGLNPNLQNSNGVTLMHEAVFHGRDEAVMLLLAYGADPNLRDKETGRTPIHQIQNWGHPIRQILIDNGADLTIKDNWGWTADVPFSDFFVEFGEAPHGLQCVPRKNGQSKPS
jgi:ankyrin repeat protein